MSSLHVGGPCAARALDLDPVELGLLPADVQIADIGSLAPGRTGLALWLRGLAQAARAADAKFVHVESEDGSFTANLPLDQALAEAVVLYAASDGSELPRAHGGPFRLLVVQSEDCSVNVKFLTRIEFVREAGSHTAACPE